MGDRYVWAPDRRNRAEYLIRRQLIQLSKRIFERAKACPDESERKRLHKMAKNLQSRHALTKAVPELKSHPKLTLTVEDFDLNDWLLNTPDGIVDLRSGKMLESDPDELMSKATSVGPEKGPSPLWDNFLKETTGGDEALLHYLQKLAGYSLTGSTQEQVLAFIHGPPLTGKSVFADTLAGVFGSYHETASASTFASSSSDRHPADLAALAGARLVTAVETEEGRAWDTQRIKSLTGGDRVSARFMRENFFTYRPRFQIMIFGNHEPEMHGVDEAVMRRLHIVPFENHPEEINRLLPEELEEEYPQILQWAIDGCQMWLEEGLTPPEAIVQRTEEYRQEEDTVGRFIQEQCTTDEEARVTRRELFAHWKRWCREQGEDPGTLKQLKRRFRDKQSEYGFRNARVRDGESKLRGYKGLGIDRGEEWG